jgi:hypothetical protein
MTSTNPPKPVSKKATEFNQIDNAVRYDVPVDAEHEFYTDFSDVRGEFEDKVIYNSFNVNLKDFSFDAGLNRDNKVLLFLAGMRGSGKTSELAKIAGKLHRPECFFCITCDLDKGLDLNNIEYMDILIFQIERLFEEMQDHEINLDAEIIDHIQRWFAQRVEEANHIIKRENGLEMSVDTSTPSFLSFLKLAGKLKATLMGSHQNAQIIRTVFKNNFSDFARLVNSFFENVNNTIRKENEGQELLFIIDGLEKTSTPDLRRKIIFDELNRISSIKANTIFTLPIELLPESQVLKQTCEVVSFPFIKLMDRTGTVREEAITRFIEFTYKRIDSKLFDSEMTVRKAIRFGGGSPREYLRILKYARILAKQELIDEQAIDKAIQKLAAETSHYLTEDDLKQLKKLKEANEKGEYTPYGKEWHRLLEYLIIFEYNDGTYKRVNPVVEASPLYKQYVG